MIFGNIYKKSIATSRAKPAHLSWYTINMVILAIFKVCVYNFKCLVNRNYVISLYYQKMSFIIITNSEAPIYSLQTFEVKTKALLRKRGWSRQTFVMNKLDRCLRRFRGGLMWWLHHLPGYSLPSYFLFAYTYLLLSDSGICLVFWIDVCLLCIYLLTPIPNTFFLSKICSSQLFAYANFSYFHSVHIFCLGAYFL